MRHASPAAKRAQMHDHDRPLNAGGRREARLAGSIILDGGPAPDLILSSTAARARETAEAIGEACCGGSAPLLLPQLYLADLLVCLDCIRALPEDCSTAMIVGHNPGLEELNGFLTGEQRPLRTAGLAILRLLVERWSDLGRQGGCELLRIWQP
jgi:phosphohistidine phosphatase